MLLPTMTYKEMYDHLANDLKKVQIKEEYLRPKAVREFKKSENFHLGGGMNILSLPLIISTSYFFMQRAECI